MSNKKIAIVDFGMGNLAYRAHALMALNANHITSHNLSELAQADALILPGVGAFPQAMRNLKARGLDQFLHEHVLGQQKPFLGICLGMQLLARDSQEQELTAGLGWIDGHVVKLCAKRDLAVPHVGWNNISFQKNEPMFQHINTDPHYYFDHSFHMLSAEQDIIVAACEYGENIVSAIRKNNIFATQFHPEKSQKNGLKLIRNFLNFVEAS